MMSAKQDNMMSSCACCGKTEGDGIQLRTCTACKSVRYCGVTCQRNHRPKHKNACKMRVAELRDELLFQQPESSYLGDCPICLLPLPLDIVNSCVHHTCCSKLVCRGCAVANVKRLQAERLQNVCPFCRSRSSDVDQKMLKRVQANDPNALCEMGVIRIKEGKYVEAFQLVTKAAELGHADAHCQLAIMYQKGHGVEKDKKKEVYHLEEASIKGHLDARFCLSQHDMIKGRIDLIITANLGHDKSMQALKKCYTNGVVSKEDFASALRAHHAAVDEMKSPQREAAKLI